MSKLDPKLLQVFADVVDQGSFSKAADIRETNASYITRQIKKLEADLNVRLLNRSTRAIALTESGQAIYQQARQLNEVMSNVATISDQQSDVLRGSLRITSAVYVGRKFVYPIVERLCDQYPEINIDLQLSDDHVDIIKDRFDLALRIWKPKDVDLIGQKLLDVNFLIAAAPTFIEQHGMPQSIEELVRLPAVVYGRKGHTNKAFNYFDNDGELRSFSVNANLCVNDAEQLNITVANGKRYFVPTNFMVADKIKSGELVQLLPDLQMPKLEALYAVYPNRALSSVARLLITQLKQDLQAFQLP